MKKPIAAIGALALALTACGGRQDNATTDTGAQLTCAVDKDTRISIATGNNTGVYFALGNAFADQISQATGGKVKATAAETGASVQNIQQLVAGNYQVAFSLADTAADAVRGKDSFDKPQPVQALARIYSNSTQVLVRNGSGINTVADMKGKRVSTGSPKSGTEVIAQRVLKAAGLDPDKDISPQRLDLTKTVDGMKDGTIDAMFFSGGLPTPGITDLMTTAKDRVKFLDLPAALLTEMKKINPVYDAGVIAAETYKTPGDVNTIVVPNVLLVKDDIDANLACVLTKALYDKQPELVKANGAAKGITLDVARKTDPVKLNRGAEKALDTLNAPK